MIRTIDEILERAEERKKWQALDEFLEKSEEKRKWQEFDIDTFGLKLLPVRLEPLTPEEQQREWQEMLAAAKAKATSKDEVLLPVSGHECWGISPKLENLNLTGAAGGIGAVGK